MSKLKDKLKEISSKISKIGRNGKANWIFFDKTKMSEKMTYEEWYNKNEEEIWIELAEIGADREMDFNSEVEFNNRYEDYLNQNK